MAFVRIKKIKGKEYAYLVENKWENGKVRQKTIKYLGRANEFKTEKINSFDEKSPLKSLIINTLTSIGFNKNLELNGISVDLQSLSVKKNNKDVVIKINEGFLSTISLNKLFNYEPLEEIKPGMKLARILGETGIEVTKDCFIKLYKNLHNNILN